jgi:carbon monoxide dehydrogenase subunit G
MSIPINGCHKIQVEASASDVWQAMRRYGDLSWAEGIDEVELEGDGVGMLRKVRLSGSSDWILERLTARDDDAMTFSYAIEGDGMPGLKNYSAHVQAIPDGDGCVIQWECRAEAEESDAEALAQGLAALAEGIATLFAAQFSR